MALKYHPDKNRETDTKEIFQSTYYFPETISVIN